MNLRPGSMTTRTVELLREGPKTSRQIAEFFGKRQENVSAMLRKLEEAKHIRRSGFEQRKGKGTIGYLWVAD